MKIFLYHLIEPSLYFFILFLVANLVEGYVSVATKGSPIKFETMFGNGIRSSPEFYEKCRFL